jgi:hypothetical protein
MEWGTHEHGRTDNLSCLQSANDSGASLADEKLQMKGAPNGTEKILSHLFGRTGKVRKLWYRGILLRPLQDFGIEEQDPDGRSQE